MKKAEDYISDDYAETLIPISVIEYYRPSLNICLNNRFFRCLDKSSSPAPIEEMLKNDFLETELIASDLRELKNRFKDLAESIYK